MADETKKDEPAKVTFTGRRINEDKPAPAGKTAVSSKVKEETGTTAGKDLGGKGKDTGFPIQEKNEPQSVYMARVAAYRANPKSPQRKAIGEMLAGESKE